MTTKTFALLLASNLLVTAGAATAQVFIPGDLVVSAYGSPASTSFADGEITPITLEQYALPTPVSALLISSETLPTTASGSNVGIVGEYGSSSEGTLSLSGDGHYLVIGGYDAAAAANGIQAATNSANGSNFAPGTPWSTSTIALGQSAAVDVPRVVATIDAGGNVNTSTVLNDVYNTNNLRSAYTPDGTNFYISGQGAGVGDQGGVYTTTLGTNTTTGGSAPTPIVNVVSTRTVTEYNGNIYYSTDQNSKSKGTQTGIFEYSGTPTTSQGANTGTMITPANNGGSKKAGTLVSYSPEGFAFANPTTLYVADTGDPKAGGTGAGVIQKWSLVSGAWQLDYILTDANFVSPATATSVTDGETGFEALTLNIVGGKANIYAVSYTAGDADPNGLYAIADTLSATTLPTGVNAETFTELATAPGDSNAGSADYNFKGVSFAPVGVPEPSAWATLLGGLGCLVFMARRRLFKAPEEAIQG